MANEGLQIFWGTYVPIELKNELFVENNQLLMHADRIYVAVDKNCAMLVCCLEISAIIAQTILLAGYFELIVLEFETNMLCLR